MIQDGWLEGAERVPGHPAKVNGGVNPATGFVAHSAEGWEAALRTLVADVNRRASWHFSNLLDGRLLQHYPITAQCWHGGSGFPNSTMVSMEHEGMAPSPLTDAQIATTVRVIRELIGYRGWKAARPRDSADRLATLYEHRECIRFGSDPTACPSDRIHWPEILDNLQEENDMMQPWNAIAAWFENREIPPPDVCVMQARTDLNLPESAKMVRLDVYREAGGGPLTIRHGRVPLVAGVLENTEVHATVDVELAEDGTCYLSTDQTVMVRRIGALGYWT